VSEVDLARSGAGKGRKESMAIAVSAGQSYACGLWRHGPLSPRSSAVTHTMVSAKRRRRAGILVTTLLTCVALPGCRSTKSKSGPAPQANEPTSSSVGPKVLVERWEHGKGQGSLTYRLLAVSDDGRAAFGATDGEGNWFFFDPRTGSPRIGTPPIRRYGPPGIEVSLPEDFSFARFSEDGNTLYAGISSELSAFDVRSGRALFSIENNCSPPCGGEGSYAYALLGSHEIAALSDYDNMHIFDSSSGKTTRRISLLGTYVSSAPAAHIFAEFQGPPCPPKPAQIGVYSEQPLKLIRTIGIRQSDFGLANCDWAEIGRTSIELARDGRYLAVRAWTISRSPRPSQAPALPEESAQLEMPKPRHVLIFDTDTGKQAGSFDAEANFDLQAASLSTDGKQLVLAGPHETYERDQIRWKTTRLDLEIRLYDWKSRTIEARGFAPLSWDNFGKVLMLTGGEIVVQLGQRVGCYVPASPRQ
jgi:hypothetical protein